MKAKVATVELPVLSSTRSITFKKTKKTKTLFLLRFLWMAHRYGGRLSDEEERYGRYYWGAYFPPQEKEEYAQKLEEDVKENNKKNEEERERKKGSDSERDSDSEGDSDDDSSSSFSSSSSECSENLLEDNVV